MTGRGRHPADAIDLSPEDRARIEGLVGDAARHYRLAQRARIILLLSAAEPVREVAQEVGVSEPTVRLWRSRFRRDGVAGLLDAPRQGRPREVADDTAEHTIRTALAREPPGRGRWSLRALSRETGMSVTTLHRTCRELGIPLPAAAARSAGAGGRRRADPAAGAGRRSCAWYRHRTDATGTRGPPDLAGLL